MSMKSDARINLEMAGLLDKNSAYGGMLGEAAWRLLETHFAEGHSGMSHEYTLRIFNDVARGKALTAKYLDWKKQELDKFARENMIEPWSQEMIKEMIGERPIETEKEDKNEMQKVL